MTALIHRWRTRAAELERYAPEVAEAFRTAADELEAVEKVDSVTLQEAHAIGGYSVDHLRVVVKEGKLENVGTKARIRIRRTDVPVKPGHQVLRENRATRPFKASAVVASALTRTQ